MGDVEKTKRPSSWYQHGKFFFGWLRNPRSVGAVFPSSPSVGKLLVTGIRPGARVIELGGGTGTVTQAILDAGVDRDDLLVLEKDATFAKFLTRRFPGVKIINADAVTLDRYADELPGPIDFVVSGLPLLLFSAEEKAQLLEHVFKVLAPTGRFHQFTYVARCAVPAEQLQALGARASLIGVAPFNVPPAFVYRLRRSVAGEQVERSLLRTSLRKFGVGRRAS
jgi:phosphatidylethanolamine/phosphatidyl-N-methylethanolamine N-methyltransferase